MMSKVFQNRVQFFFCLLCGAAVSVALGQDANFDLRNYHLYTPFSILTGRLEFDIQPGGTATTLNPTLDFIYLGLAMGPLANCPRILAAVMGLWYGLLIYIALRLALLLFEDFSKPERPFLMVIGTLAAVTGAATFSEIGTTLNDIPTAAMILAGLLFVLKASGRPDDTKSSKSNYLIAGGILFGLSAGCKLTGAIYAPALCLALLLTLPPQVWIRSVAFFSAGWFTGFIPIFSWWGWVLWSHFGSPTFPFFNNVFGSSLVEPLSYLDKRYLPQGLWQWLAYPFLWTFHEQKMLAADTPFRDPRMAIAYVTFIAFAVAVMAKIFRSLKSQQPQTERPLTQTQRITLAFLIFSYIAWLSMFSIMRYAVTIEVLSVLGAIAIIPFLARRFFPYSSRRASLTIAVLVCVLSLAITRPMYWGRVPYGNTMFDVDMSWTPPDALFLIYNRPAAYLAAFVPTESRARFIDNSILSDQKNWPLGKKAHEIVGTNPGPVFMILNSKNIGILMKGREQSGFSELPSGCRSIQSNMEPSADQSLYACQLSITN